MDRKILGGHVLRSHNLFYDLFSFLESERLLNVETGLLHLPFLCLDYPHESVVIVEERIAMFPN